jgi:hypothetical protein
MLLTPVKVHVWTIARLQIAPFPKTETNARIYPSLWEFCCQ